MLAWIRALASRIRTGMSLHHVDEEFDREMESHLELLTAENVQRGMQPEEARRAARIRFGGTTQLKETNRQLRGWPLLEAFFQDMRYALRMLRKNQGFAAVAVLTLALGIGANTAIFSVVYAVLLKPLPFPNPSQLVFLSEAKPEAGVSSVGASYDDFTELRAQSKTFSGFTGITTHELTLTGRGDPTVADIAGITPELFDVLGTRPLLGRVFVVEDGKQGAAPVAILSETVWRNRFAADSNVIGSSVTLDNRPYTIIGVVGSEPGVLFLPRRIQFWIPVTQDPLFSTFIPKQGLKFLGVIGRVKPGVSLALAQAEMDLVAARLARKFPAENSGFVFRLKPLQRVIVGDARTALLVLLGAVGLVLLVACANISNLLLARATSRGKEIALRLALGAGRGRMVRQLLTESAVLGLVGGTVGVLLAYWGVRAIVSSLPEDIPQVHAIRVDASVLIFALTLAILASLIFGLAPAFFAAGSNVQGTLKEGAAHSSEPRARRFARGFLAVAEVAVAMVLLVAAGLLLRSFATLTSVSPGFAVAGLVKGDIQLPRFQYAKPEQWTAFSDELLRRLHSQGGLRDCAVGVPLPLNAQGSANLPFELVGEAPLPKGIPESAHFASIGGDYFHVMGIPLLRGRTFDEHDVASSPDVMIISEAFAHRFFPNQDPVGKQLLFNFPPNPAVPRQIVGIVGDIRDDSIAKDPGPMMYVPFDQMPLWGVEVVVRSNLSLGSLAAAIRQEAHEIDKDLPVTDISPMASSVDTSVAQPRFRTWLIGSFAALALVLAAAGIFGVISYSVSRRTHEIGIRIALGASAGNVTRLILGESARLVLIGLAAGVPIALGLGRFLSNLLFGVHASDPATFLAVGLLLFTVATLAAYAPARRATHADPMLALRHE